MIESTRIWDATSHCAFTDIARWEGRFYVTFRESNAHVYGAGGKIRVICSEDGETWTSFALLEEQGADLRDPKLSIDPHGRLMLNYGCSYYDGRRLIRREPRVAFLSPGADEFDQAIRVNIDTSISTNMDWLWRVTWHEGTAYGVIYQHEGDSWKLHVVKSADALYYEAVHTFNNVQGAPNEATLRFTDDGEMMLFIRNELGDGYIARARPPFQHWRVRSMGERVGGPNMMVLEDGTVVMAFRRYSTDPRGTVLGVLGHDDRFVQTHRTPHVRDCGYAGLVEHEGELWISDYSQHLRGTAIYLSRVPIDEFEQ